MDDVRLVFNELQANNLIPSTRNLKRKNAFLHPCQTFHGGILFRKNIYYSQLYENGLPKDCIRVILLHEEAHMVGDKESPLLIRDFSIIFSFIISIAIINILSKNIIPEFIFPILISLILIVYLFRKEGLNQDENSADNYAIRIFKETYGVKEPSKTLEIALSSLNKNHGLRYWLCKKLLKGFDPHTKHDERVKRIAKKYDG